MELERKTMNRMEWPAIGERILKHRLICTPQFAGTIGYLKICRLPVPLVIQRPAHPVTIAETGYTWIQLAPQEKHWWLTAMFDAQDHLFECYFDMTRQNVFVPPENPYFIDLKLDVAVDPAAVRILDQKELDQALAEQLISPTEHQMAIDTADQIVRTISSDRPQFWTKMQQVFQTMKQQED